MYLRLASIHSRIRCLLLIRSLGRDETFLRQQIHMCVLKAKKTKNN